MMTFRSRLITTDEKLNNFQHIINDTRKSQVLIRGNYYEENEIESISHIYKCNN